ncbi:MAG TPA: DUF134 domain-containing protein [Acidobacteriota bacterium]|nr:DUF134 domain-containing protein [Acidobacteriota bacterium]HNR38450.1 DUF134 domain-containing protein [Acidobacteriota bacterium]HNU00511.1 DUF134 domain-containing protein [Acidobacteriota bacterium]HPB27366.1 DUF134 domain-containing protein [Acidobacteriota bacterium]HQO25637.1 DUF134 domain-containing protein [Acidobacteriota bacterium]
MSPRPCKPRRCGSPYGSRTFKPARVPMSELESIHLAHDELETLRLCDLLGLAQEAAGRRMGVSRGTVQRLVWRARYKVAQALVEECALILSDPDNQKELS